MMSELSDSNIQKADVNIFLNQNFARQTEMMHINFLNLGVADWNGFSQSNIRTCYGTAV